MQEGDEGRYLMHSKVFPLENPTRTPDGSRTGEEWIFKLTSITNCTSTLSSYDRLLEFILPAVRQRYVEVQVHIELFRV